jgi:endonuclease G
MRKLLVALLLSTGLIACASSGDQAPSPSPADVPTTAATAPAPADLPPSDPFSVAGLPAPTSASGPFTVLTNIGYAVGYSDTRGNPLWSCYHIVAKPFGPTPERPSRFGTDTRTTARVTHDDYTHSGFDRGHMTPNYAIASRFGEEAQRETFLMSNICPHAPKLNQQTWRALEATIANDYAAQFGEVWVVVGPIFGASPERLKGKVEVPDAFYCIVAGKREGVLSVLAVVMEQIVSGTHPLRPFVVTVDQVEAKTGLNFFPAFAEGTAASAFEGRVPDAATWSLDQALSAAEGGE